MSPHVLGAILAFWMKTQKQEVSKKMRLERWMPLLKSWENIWAEDTSCRDFRLLPCFFCRSQLPVCWGGIPPQSLPTYIAGCMVQFRNALRVSPARWMAHFIILKQLTSLEARMIGNLIMTIIFGQKYHVTQIAARTLYCCRACRMKSVATDPQPLFTTESKTSALRSILEVGCQGKWWQAIEISPW